MCMRPLRQLIPNARYHVGARANRKLLILDAPWVKDILQQTIIKAKKKYKFRVENFCIMGSHFHMIIQPGEGENLSRIMQWILSRFATLYNRITGLTGHVWGGRFFSLVIHSVKALVHTFDYIDANPVKAGLVKSCLDWKYGGLYQSRNGKYGVVDQLWEWMYDLFPNHKLLQIGSA